MLCHAGKLGALLLLLVLQGCSSRTAPAPVTTLELRENFYQQRNRGSLNASSYTVQRGDTLYAIAFRAGKDVRELAGINGIASPYTIYPGQTLKLSGSVKKPASKRAVVSKKVPAQRQNTNKNNSSQVKSNSSVKPAKPVAPKNQKGYVQTGVNSNKKTANPTLNRDLVQWQASRISSMVTKGWISPVAKATGLMPPPVVRWFTPVMRCVGTAT